MFLLSICFRLEETLSLLISITFWVLFDKKKLLRIIAKHNNINKMWVYLLDFFNFVYRSQFSFYKLTNCTPHTLSDFTKDLIISLHLTLRGRVVHF